MRDIHYLLDENADPDLRAGLLRRNPEMIVWQVGDPGAPSRSTPDPEILRWCEENTFVLVTNNRRSMPRHLRDHLAEGRHVPGIFQLNPHMTMGDTIEELVLIWEVASIQDYRDAIIYLPLD